MKEQLLYCDALLYFMKLNQGSIQDKEKAKEMYQKNCKGLFDLFVGGTSK
jgi:hypothetical protein